VARGGIVTIYSVEQDGDVRFLTMERVEGQSLDQVIPRGGLPLGQVLEIGATLADALAASHEKGIIHRDLKPANIMLAGRERRVKVLDFGLAKLRAEVNSGELEGERAGSARGSGSGSEPGVVSDAARASDAGIGRSGTAPPTGRRRLARWLAFGAGAVAFVAITAVVGQRVGLFSRVPPSRPFEAITLKKLTDTGKVVAAAISPDGRYLAYSQVDERNRSGVWVRQIQTGSDVAIVPPDDRLRSHHVSPGVDRSRQRPGSATRSAPDRALGTVRVASWRGRVPRHGPVEGRRPGPGLAGDLSGP
jgi:serine/threonine protein kinase